MKLHHGNLKSVWENEAKRFRFMLTLWPPAKVKGQWKQYKMVKSMVPISMAHNYEKNKLNSLRVMSNVKVFLQSKMAGQPDGQTWLIT